MQTHSELAMFCPEDGLYILKTVGQNDQLIECEDCENMMLFPQGLVVVKRRNNQHEVRLR